MSKRFLRVGLLLIGVALIAWPGMMLLHELGHVVAAWGTGGTVTRLVWHPLTFSRTDVAPNPSPLIVVWAGPIVGCVLPMLLERGVAFVWPVILYAVRLIVGFCLIANGAYIGLGGFDRVGDAGVMLQLGSPLWVLITFGILACGLGLWYWHLASYRLGLGHHSAATIPWPHIAGALASGLLLNLLALILGDPGS